MDPRSFSYESMGTHWRITIWDALEDAALAELQETIVARSAAFARTYSRFEKTSLIWSLTEKRGVTPVPPDLVRMLRMYERLYDLSGGKCNPLVGFALSDLGYDAEYSLRTKENVRAVPSFHEALRIVDDGHIELFQSVLIDLGALGKGYFVDRIAEFLEEKGIRRFLVDGSGDMLYRGNGEPIRAGLEHPGDTTKVIGVLEMRDGAMCGSASNRRRWGKYHHTIDPFSLTSPEEIIATWVMADSAALADGLATCFFLCEPERFEDAYAFQYCLLNREYNIKRSAGFAAELF
jgi:thiamine biosynthesis lipoprotein